MFTLDEIKALLDADDASTPDGYNNIRANLMSKLSPVITEVDGYTKQISTLTDENTRLKAANATLYSKVESQIMDAHKAKKDEEEHKDDPPEKTAAEILKENVNMYKDF